MSPALAGLLAGTLVALLVVAGARARTASRSARVAARVVPVGAPAPTAGVRRPTWGSGRRLEPPPWAAARLADAFPGLDPGAAVTAWAVAAPVGVVLGAVVGGPVVAALAVVAVLLGPVIACGWRRGSADRAVEAALPEALEAVARALRSGAGPHQALTEAAGAVDGPLAAELDVVAARLDGGVGLADALAAFERRRPLPGVRLAVAALVLGAEAGGAHARALDGVAASVRARLDVSGEVRALAAQARLSAVVIAAAPLAFAVLAVGGDGASAAFLLGTPLGLACLATGLVLDGVGAWWMHRLAEVEA